MKLVPNIGFPIMVKASEGGGGKAIRVVTELKNMESAFRQVAGETPIHSPHIHPIIRPIFIPLFAPHSPHYSPHIRPIIHRISTQVAGEIPGSPIFLMKMMKGARCVVPDCNSGQQLVLVGWSCCP